MKTKKFKTRLPLLLLSCKEINIIRAALAVYMCSGAFYRDGFAVEDIGRISCDLQEYKCAAYYPQYRDPFDVC